MPKNINEKIQRLLSYLGPSPLLPGCQGRDGENNDEREAGDTGDTSHCQMSALETRGRYDDVTRTLEITLLSGPPTRLWTRVILLGQ